ncbi:MAG: inorganic phosphate transporter [Planctomycetota bacterium]|nr:inorganic phosphate transporter [Planctomycetota bacterium]
MSSTFLYGALALALIMLLWNTIEVGRNDAANLVNAVFGARVLTRQWAVRIAGIGVVIGATMGNQVVETARKGIFDPVALSGSFDDALARALSIYISVYIVNTILLHAYSSFGMPVSTTACLVFSLLGAAISMAPIGVVRWTKAGEVIAGILCSIALTGIVAFMMQRAVRGAIRDKWASLSALLLHGGWVGGGMLAGLTYFMLIKGMKSLSFIERLNEKVIVPYGAFIVVLVLWVVFAIAIHMLLVAFRQRAAKLLFPILAIIGMVSMAFAFGQNDLANCASPGLAVIKLFQVRHHPNCVAEATESSIPWQGLFVCGVLLVCGMATKGAKRVTQAEVRMGSQGDHVKLWAPQWCISLASKILRRQRAAPSLAPAMTKSPRGKTMHYDPLRACVIMSVSACVIATASGFALPVSTTYVAFAAVVATGLADRIFSRGDAALKLGRSIWVVFSWFAAAGIAVVAAAAVCQMVFRLGIVGILIGLALSAATYRIVKRRADAQEDRVRREAEERMNPDDFALEYEG